MISFMMNATLIKQKQVPLLGKEKELRNKQSNLVLKTL